MWIVKRRATARYLGAYEWVRSQKDAVRFNSRRAAKDAVGVASLQNTGTRIVRLVREHDPAQELRTGIEQIVEEFDCTEGRADRRTVCGVLRALLNRVDAGGY